MKKIVIITSSYYPKVGGVEKHVRSTVAELVKLNYSPTILVRFDEAIPAKQTVDGVTIIRLPKKVDKYNLGLWLLKNKKIFNDVSTIHSHDYYLAPIRKIFPKIRWVHTFHGYEGYPLHPDAPKIRQKIADSVDATVCVGDFIEKWYGTKCDLVTYGGVDIGKEGTKTKKPKYDFVFIGRLEADTGFNDYLAAFLKLNKEQPDLKLLIVGDGLQKNLIKPNNKHIEFIGWQENTLSYLLDSKVAFVSGYLGILEAAANSIPVVAHYNNSLKEDYLKMHPMAENMYIANGTNEVYAQARRALAADKDKLKEFHDWAKQQTWKNLALKYVKLYTR